MLHERILFIRKSIFRTLFVLSYLALSVSLSISLADCNKSSLTSHHQFFIFCNMVQKFIQSDHLIITKVGFFEVIT